MSQAFHREPCFWTTTNAAQTGYNTPDREKTVMVQGRKRKIKHPQTGHQGDYDQPIRMGGLGVRYLRLIKSSGNDVFYVITNGAADLDPNSAYAQDRKAKARALGWFPVGACPVALLGTGEMVPDHFVDQSLLEAKPCAHGTYSTKQPCPHALAEKAARTAAHNAVQAERVAAFKDPNAKLIEAQQQQTRELVGAITGSIKEALTAVPAQPAPAVVAEPAPPPKAGKRE